MPEETATAPQQQPPASAPTETAKAETFDANQWLGSLNEPQKKAIDEYVAFRTKPLSDEMHGLRTKAGRLEKAADPAIVSRYSKVETLMDVLKTGAKNVYGLSDDDLKDIDTPEALEVALRFASRGKPQNGAGPQQAAPANAAEQQAWQEFLASRSGKATVAQQRTDPLPTGTPIIGSAVNSDNIDKLYLEGKVSGDAYYKFINTGEVPSKVG